MIVTYQSIRQFDEAVIGRIFVILKETSQGGEGRHRGGEDVLAIQTPSSIGEVDPDGGGSALALPALE